MAYVDFFITMLAHWFIPRKRRKISSKSLSTSKSGLRLRFFGGLIIQLDGISSGIRTMYTVETGKKLKPSTASDVEEIINLREISDTI